MISIFELKHRSYCRCLVRTPYYIKNLFLIGALLVFMGFVQLVYFGSDGVYVKSITKLLRGLNSDIFNFLSEHRAPLRLQDTLSNYPLQTISSQSFVSECLRLSRPCLMNELARDSGAYAHWRFSPTSGNEYLTTHWATTPVEVFIDKTPIKVTFSNPAFNSFKEQT